MTATPDFADKASLRKYLVKCFSLSDLKDLASDLNIDYESLLHETRADLARELIEYCFRRDLREQLETAVRERRPTDFPITDSLIEHMRQRRARWASADQPAALLDLLERADQLCRERVWNEAVDTCDFIVQVSKRQSTPLIGAAAHFYRGIIFHSRQRWEDALTAYDKAKDSFWQLGDSYLHEYALTRWALAALKQSIGKHDEALDDYIEANKFLDKLRLESIKRAEPVIAAQYQKMIKDIDASIKSLGDSKIPFGYNFPIMKSRLPPHKPARYITYFRDSQGGRHFSAEGETLSPTKTESISSWEEFDDQIGRNVSYFAVQVTPSMAEGTGLKAGDYLLACRVQDKQLLRRGTTFSILDETGSYLYYKIIGGRPDSEQLDEPPYAYVDVILKKSIKT